jgi:hypothetical protein
MSQRARPRLIESEPLDDELLFETGEPQVLIRGIATVQAQCTAVSKAFYFGQPKLTFDFKVVNPEEHVGTRLKMFARNAPEWKGHPPVSSKLWKIAAVVLERLPRREDRVTQKMFLKKVFKCELGTSGKGVAAYTVVKMITEKVAG